MADAWNAREYLRQYYSSTVTADDAANTRFAARELRELGRRFESALEIGCGPTVHHTAPFAPWVERFTLADYSLDNLAEVRHWVEDVPEAFDWDLWLSGMLAIEEHETAGGQGHSLAERKRQIRRTISDITSADIFRPDASLGARTFDLVTSYYCLECVTSTPSAWSLALARLCARLRPNGVLFLGSLRGSRRYTVFEREYPCCPVDERDLLRELSLLGFPAETIRIEVTAVPEFAAQGFDSVCCVRAVKSC